MTSTSLDKVLMFFAARAAAFFTLPAFCYSNQEQLQACESLAFACLQSSLLCALKVWCQCRDICLSTGLFTCSKPVTSYSPHLAKITWTLPLSLCKLMTHHSQENLQLMLLQEQHKRLWTALPVLIEEYSACWI